LNTTAQTGNLIGRDRGRLAERIVELQYGRQPAIWSPFGPAGKQKSVRDTADHLAYLAEAMAAGDSALFYSYVAWARALFDGLKLPADTLAGTLDCMAEVIRESLTTEAADLAVTFIDNGRAALVGTGVSATFFLDGNPLKDVAQGYLSALLKGDRHAAARLVLDRVEKGISVRDIYLNVIEPSQREVGRLWQANQVSVAQEHYCTAATQLIMSQLYPWIAASERVGRRMVATAVGGELHEVGIRMVADFFEMAGWDTYYLGANTPPEAVVSIVAERKPDLLAVSATMIFHLSRAADLIKRVRDAEAGKKACILLGGYPFNISLDLPRQLGADGGAPDAALAVAVGQKMVGAGVPR
jgi:methanogenic corrinoid protein MtbC1